MTGGVEVDGVRGDPAPPRSRGGPLVAVLAAILGSVILFDVTGPPAAAVHGGDTLPSQPLEIDIVESRTFGQILPGFEGWLVAAVAQPGSAVILTWKPDASEPVRSPLGPLTDLRFDPGGTWLAGTQAGSAGSRLWLGRTGGGIFPLDQRIEGFAWHDSLPAHLAYLTRSEEGGGLYVTDLLVGGTRLVTGDPPDGRLERWGEWGFGLTHPGRVGSTTLLLAGGRRLEIDGVPVGELADGRIAFSPFFALDLPGGTIVHPRWPHPFEEVQAVERSPDGRWLAVHLGESPDPDSGPVVRIADPDGSIRRELAGASAHPAMAWDRSGRFLVVAVDGDLGTEVAVIDVAGGDPVILAVSTGVGAVIQDLVVLDR
ncbi:MAG: hypothetical protein R6X29_00545 [Acidimicrobiia bacterium]|jgi:hypothetical protein